MSFISIGGTTAFTFLTTAGKITTVQAPTTKTNPTSQSFFSGSTVLTTLPGKATSVQTQSSASNLTSRQPSSAVAFLVTTPSVKGTTVQAKTSVPYLSSRLFSNGIATLQITNSSIKVTNAQALTTFQNTFSQQSSSGYTTFQSTPSSQTRTTVQDITATTNPSSQSSSQPLSSVSNAFQTSEFSKTTNAYSQNFTANPSPQSPTSRALLTTTFSRQAITIPALTSTSHTSSQTLFSGSSILQSTNTAKVTSIQTQSTAAYSQYIHSQPPSNAATTLQAATSSVQLKTVQAQTMTVYPSSQQSSNGSTTFQPVTVSGKVTTVPSKTPTSNLLSNTPFNNLTTYQSQTSGKLTAVQLQISSTSPTFLNSSIANQAVIPAGNTTIVQTQTSNTPSQASFNNLATLSTSEKMTTMKEQPLSTAMQTPFRATTAFQSTNFLGKITSMQPRISTLNPLSQSPSSGLTTLQSPISGKVTTIQSQISITSPSSKEFSSASVAAFPTTIYSGKMTTDQTQTSASSRVTQTPFRATTAFQSTTFLGKITSMQPRISTLNPLSQSPSSGLTTLQLPISGKVTTIQSQISITSPSSKEFSSASTSFGETTKIRTQTLNQTSQVPSSDLTTGKLITTSEKVSTTKVQTLPSNPPTQLPFSASAATVQQTTLSKISPSQVQTSIIQSTLLPTSSIISKGESSNGLISRITQSSIDTSSLMVSRITLSTRKVSREMSVTSTVTNITFETAYPSTSSFISATSQATYPSTSSSISTRSQVTYPSTTTFKYYNGCNQWPCQYGGTPIQLSTNGNCYCACNDAWQGNQCQCKLPVHTSIKLRNKTIHVIYTI